MAFWNIASHFIFFSPFLVTCNKSSVLPRLNANWIRKNRLTRFICCVLWKLSKCSLAYEHMDWLLFGVFLDPGNDGSPRQGLIIDDLSVFATNWMNRTLYCSVANKHMPAFFVVVLCPFILPAVLFSDRARIS